MFRIRKEQLRQLGQPTHKSFVEMVAQYLREHFFAWVEELSAAELRAWVEEALAKATHYGVHREPEATQLILLFLALGIDADETMPWVRETLGDGELLEIGKIRRLIAQSQEHAIDGVSDVIVYDEMGT